MARVLGRTLAIVVVVGSEILAARLAWHTMGEIAQDMLVLLVLYANVFFVPLALWRPNRGLPPLLLFWLLIVPANLFLGVQLGRAHLEAGRIVEFAHAQRTETGAFPDDLREYRFRDPRIEDGIYRYRSGSPDVFAVYYGAPGQEDVAHWYDSESGWGYYPD